MSVRLRPVLALGVCAAVAAATGVASAATPKVKPVCNLIQDPAGDGGVVAPSNDVDIISGDVAVIGKTVTAVLRLAGDPSSLNPQAIGGKNYYVSFTAPDSEQSQFLSAEFDPTAGGPAFHTGYEEVIAGTGNKTSDTDPAEGTVKGNVITITAPTSAFAGRVSLKPGKKLTSLTAEVFALIGTSTTGGLLAPADDATGKDYVTGTPSCAAAKK